ncbi:phytanoyl-CoA dioxygenase family protein [Sodalis ligni]|uniref:phytanoyl-CoA dioxygenase family protein n=1 Tax=Sodalis ligni TaxID=2697027 RepID=UPI00193EC4E6|nr:phytanoyl-CoA dioxygenase family protein [Sodalis ligni]QWA13489.1 phytanoyl-CoA dioxygenase family protein [Sodalis ligni]
MKTQSESYLEALGATADLSRDMIDQLETKGYVVIRDVIDPDWLEDMRAAFDGLIKKEGDNLAAEHHQEETATRIANMINKGTVWEKVWAHPIVLSVCRHIFQRPFKISSLNGREALHHGGHQPLHADWKKPRPDFPKVHLVNAIWAIDDLSAANGAPRIIPGTHHRPELPEDILPDPALPHPDEAIFAAPAGSVMIYNAHAWHGGTTNTVGTRRRVLHGLYCDREDAQQQDQRKWLKPETASRLTPAQKWLLDVL